MLLCIGKFHFLHVPNSPGNYLTVLAHSRIIVLMGLVRPTDIACQMIDAGQFWTNDGKAYADSADAIN